MPRRSLRIAELATKSKCDACFAYSKPLTTICEKCKIHTCSTLCAVGFEVYCEACNISKICKTCSERYCTKCSDMMKLPVWGVDTFIREYDRNYKYNGTIYFTNILDANAFYNSGIVITDKPEQVDVTPHILYHVLNNTSMNNKHDKCPCKWNSHAMLP